MESHEIGKSELDSRVYTKTFFKKNKGKALLTLVVYIVESALNIVLSWYLQVLLDVIGRNASSELGRLTMLFFVIILIMTLLIGIRYAAYPRFLEQAMVQYRNQVFQDLLSKNIVSFSAENSGTYLSAFTNDMLFIQDKYLKNIFRFIQMLIMLVGSLGLMFFYNISLTLIAIALAILPMLGSILLGGQLAEKEKVVSQNNEVYVSSLKDILSGFPTIKTFQAETDVYDQFDEINQTLEFSKKRANQTEELIVGVGGLTTIIAQLGVMLIGAYFVLNESNHVTIGMIVAFTNLMNFVIQPLAVIPQIMAERKAARGLINKLSQNLMNRYKESGDIVLEKKSTPPMIRLENVSYSHGEGKFGVTNVSLNLEPGKIYGVVGSSGSGKSTLLNLIMKSHQDYSGKITVDQVDLKHITSKSLYDSFSLIQQEFFIFNTTIENNITMFKSFPKDAVERAIQISGLSDLIKSKGEAYQVGENGKYLSGGERQRIAIARALIRENSVILVDEVTSALDNLTAQQINQTLLSMKNMTRVVVTHRLDENTLSQFDEIIVMKKGQVEEVGSFENLMAEKGYFYSLFMVEN